MYPKREVFSNSPLALVAAEIRFTDAPRLRQQATLDAVALELEPFLPVSDLQQEHTVNFPVAGGQPQVQVTSGRIFKNVQGTVAATLFPNRLSVETTSYVEFAEFRAEVLRCTQALVGANVTPAIQRIGLRYLDEIRTPSSPVRDARNWADWVDGRLVDHLHLGPASASVVQAEGTLTYDLGGRRGLNFRFAALQQGAVVMAGNLARAPFDDSLPFFVLDFDGYQDFTGLAATLLDVDVVAKTLDAVHEPSGATFQSAITDRARDLFRTRTA